VVEYPGRKDADPDADLVDDAAFRGATSRVN